MKTFIKTTSLMLVVFVLLSVLLTACSNKQTSPECETHKLEYTTDNDYHYLACTNCDYISESESHSFIFPNDEQTNYVCNICGYTTDTYTYHRYGILKNIYEDDGVQKANIFWDSETYLLKCPEELSLVPIGSFIKVDIQEYEIIDYKLLINYGILENPDSEMLKNYISDEIIASTQYKSKKDITISSILTESNSYITINFESGLCIKPCYNEIYDMKTGEVVEVTELKPNDMIIYFEDDDYMYIIII